MLSFSGLAWNQVSESVRSVLFGLFLALRALLVGWLVTLLAFHLVLAAVLLLGIGLVASLAFGLFALMLGGHSLVTSLAFSLLALLLGGNHLGLVASLAFSLLAFMLGSSSCLGLAVVTLLVGGFVACLTVLVVLAFMLLHFNSLFLRNSLYILG